MLWKRTSDVAALGAHATFVDSTPTKVEILIWIMSPLYNKTNVTATDQEKYHNSARKLLLFFLISILTSQSTAMVMLRLNLTTLFFSEQA